MKLVKSSNLYVNRASKEEGKNNKGETVFEDTMDDIFLKKKSMNPCCIKRKKTVPRHALRESIM